ncbi:metal ABC transporter substrate-binding protein [Streptomyces sp. SPB162]|uniref:metal ABC transporter substrate-binding protein n=1 Tax=Streptomyces sp. SPB162 TaxID=2940560 RepID=UPI002405F291|nr:metal ABC transporter substrate-binding protein [Streptomyces sp. SPB162]
MNKRHRLIPAAVAGTAALGLLTLSSCSVSDAADGSGGGGKLKVTASFYPMEFLAKEIGGENVRVTALTKPGVEPHDLELTPRQTAALTKTDVIVYLKGLQPAIDEAVKQSGVKNTADAASLTKLEEHGTEVDGHAHTTGDNHSGEGEAGADPHVWLDPVKYAEVAKGVGIAFAKADPVHAAAYLVNADTLVKKLDALNTEFADGLKNRASDTFITTHAAFGYLAERYGLVEEAIGGIDPEAEPSGARIKALQQLSAKHHVTTVFFETLASNATAKTLAGDLKLRTAVLDPLEGITDKSQGTDYFEVQRSNLKALRTALGSKGSTR